MPIIIILIVVGLAVYIQRLLYEKRWFKHLSAKVRFQDKYLTEGAETTLFEEVQNAKLLPLPWVQMKFQLNRNAQSKDAIFESDVFNILFYQRIQRSRKLTLKKRGIYEIKSLDLLSHDLLITSKYVHMLPNHAAVTVHPRPLGKDQLKVPFEKLMGTIATRRYTLEDPYLFKGIRDYQEQDSFKNINFKASARAGKWLVNTHEYTVDQKVRIFFLADKPSSVFNESEYEGGLRYAAGLLSALEEQGIPVSLETNALDALEKREPSLEVGCSEQHVMACLDLLARLDLMAVGEKGTDILQGLTRAYQADEYYVILTPCRTRDMLEGYQELRGYTDACMFISPITGREMAADRAEGYNLEEEIEGFYYHVV